MESEEAHGDVGIWSFKYSRRLAIILAVFLVVAGTARWLAKPAHFGNLGFFRDEAPLEAAAFAPVHQGKKVCSACHADEFAKHEHDVHVRVECEDCHGRGDLHVAARRANLPKTQGAMFRELEQSNCLACHRKLAARPKLFPTIEVAAHFDLVGVKDPKTPCQSCHNPHEPLFLERPVAEARKHPLIHPCSDCHSEPDIATRALPPGHVLTFQCADCHAEIAQDFAKKPHRFLDCRGCHNFHKDTEFSGSIFKNGNPKLCLMCHQAAPFKNEKVPKIESFEAHRTEMGGEGDEQKRCADCHLTKRIHRVPAKRTADATGAKP